MLLKLLEQLILVVLQALVLLQMLLEQLILVVLQALVLLLKLQQLALE